MRHRRTSSFNRQTNPRDETLNRPPNFQTPVHIKASIFRASIAGPSANYKPRDEENSKPPLIFFHSFPQTRAHIQLKRRLFNCRMVLKRSLVSPKLFDPKVGWLFFTGRSNLPVAVEFCPSVNDSSCAERRRCARSKNERNGARRVGGVKERSREEGTSS